MITWSTFYDMQPLVAPTCQFNSLQLRRDGTVDVCFPAICSDTEYWNSTLVDNE